MPLDTYSFFIFVLSGFALVWSFRKCSGARTDSITDFEYLGFSSFWGVIVLVVYEWLERHHQSQITQLLANPFVAGVILSLLGFLLGGIAGSLFRKIRFVFR